MSATLEDGAGRACDAGIVSSIVVSELEYAPPGRDSLFFDVSFTVGPGERAVLVGVNGIGKSTLLRILSGELQPDEGEFALNGTVLTMAQDAGMAAPDATLREMLIEVAPPELRTAGRALLGRRTCARSVDRPPPDPTRRDQVRLSRGWRTQRRSPRGAIWVDTSWRRSGRPRSSEW